MEELLAKVKALHDKNDFKNNGGEDKYFRMSLIMEEVGEMCEAISKNSSNFEEEHADLLIVLLGNCIAYNIDIISLTSKKLDRILKLDAKNINGHTRIITDKNKV